MIGTILKNKEEMKSAQIMKGISRLSSSCCNITEQMETVLLVWINGKQVIFFPVEMVVLDGNFALSCGPGMGYP